MPGLPTPDGDADPGSRGQVANLLLAADGERLWLVGSGPSPVFGRRLACELRRQLGRGPADWSRRPRHALNWQRAWRQALDRWFAAPPR